MQMSAKFCARGCLGVSMAQHQPKCEIGAGGEHVVHDAARMPAREAWGDERWRGRFLQLGRKVKVVCRGVLLGCARPLFPGEKRTFSAMGWVFASKIAPKMTPVKKARKSNSMKVVPDKEVDEPLAPRHSLLSTPSVELVLNGGRSSTTIGSTRSGSCCPDLRQRLGRSYTAHISA